mmetsp:Transcript_4324/g.6477  ORF Transcript_4324/g.6477 Transcript_4324/m.6477 type:complete len:271 (-) Transcript_4324:192-1004(-)|eukprot:CAMPEP_0167762520 /NCGR_PEP_ID=MMETSP0110_2-20121227/12817_1 /TAXON_ID=629695 /ORGANISM="Gymnochlora sp., Strain CCMP2014" /LENGTH=270 /DNA_ID=CAMNT_0007649411 /DNA_START=41 /DNA_END=853 /DNA_ORIENTATION=-
MSAVSTVKKLLKEFKAEKKKLDSDQKNSGLMDKCNDILANIKIAMLDFDIDGALKADKKLAKEQLVLSREVLELATFLSVIIDDSKGFERHIAQVKTFYQDYSAQMLESPRKWTVLGLNLMYLLANNKLSEFHTELELIPAKGLSDEYISYPVEIEQRLMEGSYRKVLSARKSVPSPLYNQFMDFLVQTVRERISDCTMKAYVSIPLEEGKKLFFLENDSKLAEYVKKRGWKIDGKTITWNTAAEKTISLRSKDLLKESLTYATELERII